MRRERSQRRCAAWASVFVGLLDCAYNPLLPDLRGPVQRAQQLTSRCDQSPDAEPSPALSATLVEEVAPAYSHVASGSELAPRLRGARLRFRPRADLSAEVLQRALECHQVSVILGRAPAIADDPYVLPGEWLDISADSSGDGFIVAVRIDDYTKAQQVLEHARRFAAGRP